MIRLDDNYRSTPQILGIADAVLSGGGDAMRSRPLRANRPEGPTPSVRSWASDRDEARAVVRAMRRRQNSSLPWSGMAALARTNAQLLLLEEACTAAGVPHRVRGEGPFLGQPEIRQALNELLNLRFQRKDLAVQPCASAVFHEKPR